MRRFIGTISLCAALILALGSSTVLAEDNLHKYGVEIRGGFGFYDMGDVTPSVESMQAALSSAGRSSTLDLNDSGPAGGLSLLYRPSRHTMWEIGYSALMDVENRVETNSDSTSGEIDMHGGELFFKGHVVATITDALHLDFGAGFSYCNANLLIMDNFGHRYYYDAKGRAFGLIGSVGLELLLTKHLGIMVQGGGRLANTAQYSYELTPGQRTSLSVPGGSRPMEVNLSGVFANAGLRFYFDKVTKPIDFSR
ncbi:hypothetical protein EHM69_06030 [candidate division KSB1 bacterium]|nr:MAG: hypothetical protein EHM69_06030 [candidate division KSB1 bacterium]